MEMSIDLPVLRAVQKEGRAWAFCVWEPYSPIVVMGRSGEEEKDVNIGECLACSVPVYKRRTGGGAVVLAPGMLAFSLAAKVGEKMVIKKYASMINHMVMDFLLQEGINNIEEKGVSDLAINNKKIMGSGMYRRNYLLFFQGSLLIAPDLDLFERFLKHPPREPDYRRGRRHDDFVTSLCKEGYSFETSTLVKKFRTFLEGRIAEIY